MSRKAKRRSHLAAAQGQLPPSKAAEFAASQRRKQRSDQVWLAILGLVVAGPLVYAIKENSYRRNLYATREDCIADYSERECSDYSSYHGSSIDPQERIVRRYHGPWYSEGSRVRTDSDPGPGRSLERYTAGDPARSRTGSPPTGFEPGVMRGGFGRTGSIRAGRASFGG